MKRTIETQARYDQAKKTGESIVEVGQDGETFFNLSRTHALEQYNYWVIIFVFSVGLLSVVLDQLD